MKSDLLLQIKDAEAEADRRVAAAEAEAKAILADARRQAESILADAKQQADFAHQSRLDAARKQAEKEAAKTVAAGQKRAGEVRLKVSAGLDAAAKRAVQLIEGRLG